MLLQLAYTDASDFQLLMYYPRRKAGCLLLTKADKVSAELTTMEKEMLFIIATLKEFQGMLLGVDIHVFTDHENLTFDTLNTQCVLCWQTKIEEYSPILHYIEGAHNILADNCLVTPAQIVEGKKLVEPA
jgi:hypothetical protein